MPQPNEGRTLANDPAIKEIARLLDADTATDQASDDSGSDSDTNGTGGRVQSGADNDDIEGDADANLADGAEDETAGDDVQSDAESAESSGVTIQQIAEQLGVRPSDIYNELLIPMPGAEPITLGEFKDRVQQLKALDVERQKVSDDKNDWEKGAHERSSAIE